jgi:hypothetical protein
MRKRIFSSWQGYPPRNIQNDWNTLRMEIDHSLHRSLLTGRMLLLRPSDLGDVDCHGPLIHRHKKKKAGLRHDRKGKTGSVTRMRSRAEVSQR